MKEIELPAIKESTEDYDKIETLIKGVFKRLVYLPILRELILPTSTVKNASRDYLLEALNSGRITFNRGIFSGRFNASTSKQLKELGARWDKKSESFRINLDQLPYEVRAAIGTSEARFAEKIAGIDKKLAEIIPANIADSIHVADLFDSTLWKVQKEIDKTLKGITVPAQLTPARRRLIADEWQNNMDKWIKDFTEQEIKRLRKDVQSAIFAGNRHESLVDSIRRSYDVTANKAKFLARQETGLLMAKFKESRYTDSGVPEYKWGCVAGSPAHPVRPSHKILEGKVFRWDSPPITTLPNEPQRRNNPGEDYNCRCFARPIVRFKGSG